MFFVDGSPDGTIMVIFSIVAALLLMAAWIILAGSRFIQGGIVERPERVPQLYGYAVCLVGLLLAVTSLFSIVDALFTLRSPVYANTEEWNNWAEPSVSSFEAFRATYDRAREMRGPGDAPPPPVPEDELRRRYEDLRADRIARTQAAAYRALVTSILSLLVGAGLFAWHWRWLRKRGLHADRVPATPPVTGAG